jgi:ABC-type transporter Mla MlaB component
MTTEPASTSRPVSRNVHIVLRGEVTMNDIANLRERMVQAFECQQAVLIDCAHASYLDTAVLQVLATLRVEARMLGVSLQIQGLPGSVLANAAPRGSAFDNLTHRLAG